MAKQALLEVLEQTIGKYVKNLDAESLNVAVWSGKIQLHSLELNVDAVNQEISRQANEAPNLAIPLRIIRGSFKSLEIDVPWSRLTSQSVRMKACGLHVDVQSFDRSPDSDLVNELVENEAQRVEVAVEKRLRAILTSDDHRRSSNAVSKLAQVELDETKASSKNSSFVERLVRRIIENIQLEITDVHISLEGEEGAAGVVLTSLTLETTDEDGRKRFVDRTQGPQTVANSFLHKALIINGFGIYLDEKKASHSKLLSISEGSRPTTEHSYILSPLSFAAKLRQADSNVCIEYPKYLLAAELSSLSIILSKAQLDLAANIALAVSQNSDSPPLLFPEYRPLTKVTKATAAEWWKYAYRCVGRLNGRRSWVEFFRAFQSRKKYIPLYKRFAHHETCTWLSPLSDEETALLETIEADRSISISGLMTWRNIADALVEREQQKQSAQRVSQQSKTYIFSSFFGTSDSDNAQHVDTNPPISLSLSEREELEAISRFQMDEENLSNDSKFCDVMFLLGAFKINLMSHGMRPLVALNMGRVTSEFNANADGSFVFDLRLLFLEIHDLISPRSLFPKVLRGLHNEETHERNAKDVFECSLSKSRTGDQSLRLKLIQFEAVASPLLILELKRFFSLSQTRPTDKTKTTNVLLAQSLSGSVDLFYDADEGNLQESAALLGDIDIPIPSTEQINEISNALIEAWNSKTDTSAAWVIDIDIQAPILVLPENCVDLHADVLVLDLGHLRLQYGKNESVSRVEEWFQENPKHSHSEPTLEYGQLDVNHFTFIAGKARSWHRITGHGDPPDDAREGGAVIEPISVSVSFGVENVSSTEAPRICALGVIPTVVLKICADQVVQCTNVCNSWVRLIKELVPESEQPDVVVTSATEAISPMKSLQTRGEDVKSEQQHQSSEQIPVSISQDPTFHFEMQLQRLSLQVFSAEDEWMEANLVSVNSSLTTMSNGDSVMRLCMGWFWILDRFNNDFIRMQRLVAHSNLPVSPNVLAIDDKYDILNELDQRGVFRSEFSGSSELADITFTQRGNKACLSPSIQDNFNGARIPGESDVDIIVDGRFSSLYIHWNPQAIKSATTRFTTFYQLLRDSSLVNEESLILVSPSKLPKQRDAFLSPRGSTKMSHESTTKTRKAALLVNAHMKSFEINLNSARDDLPLFRLDMVNTKVSLLYAQTGEQSDLSVSLALGDLSVKTPESMGTTSIEYRTLIGLAPGLLDSLLSVQYYNGPRAMKSIELDGVEMSSHDSFADVELSSMRLVYIQSQVLTLVEYATEGILGALAAQAASSAAAAAIEIASSGEGSMLSRVRASAFHIVVPQSATNLNHLSATVGALELEYVSHPNPGGGNGSISLLEVVFCDHHGMQLLEKSIQMDVSIVLPPEGVGTLEEQSMLIDLTFSQASFKVSKSQYGQIMSTVYGNFAEDELYLRDEDNPTSNTSEDLKDEVVDPSHESVEITHAGVSAVYIPRRICVSVGIKMLSLELLSSNLISIIKIAAVDARISYNMIPDLALTTSQVFLGNLVCDDVRPKAALRQHRSLIYQMPITPSVSDGKVQDVFFVAYECTKKGSSKLDLRIGSPRLVVIPDAVAELLDFVTVEGSVEDSKGYEGISFLPEEECTVNLDECCDAVEVSLEPQSERMSVSLRTSLCSIVLVDLGGSATSATTGTSSQLTETIVLDGQCSLDATLETEKRTGDLVRVDISAHGEKVQAYSAFGRDLRSPLQIFEPAMFSVDVTVKSVPDKGKRIDIRGAALTPLDISFSMRNAALVNAIVAGLSDCLSDDKLQEDQTQSQLSNKEANPKGLLTRARDSNDNVAANTAAREYQEQLTTERQTMKGDHVDTLTIKLTMPDATLTVINDLQGLDEALFRISLQTMVAGGQIKTEKTLSRNDHEITFNCHLHTSISANYFDSASNLWKNLLTKPWEVSTKAVRSPHQESSDDRLSTLIEIESFPCCLSFSEQFLVGLAAATRMWQIYAVAISSAVAEVGKGNEASLLDKQAEKRAVMSAARNLITTLPYAIENHTGMMAKFELPGDRGGAQSCASGVIQYFRIEPPQGNGYGGTRRYGQDVVRKKSLRVLFSDSSIDIEDLDDEVGRPRRVHQLCDGCVIVTHVEKEGKTTVLHLASSVDVLNRTSHPFNIGLYVNEEFSHIGLCQPNNVSRENQNTVLLANSTSDSSNDGNLSRVSNCFGIPAVLLESLWSSYSAHGTAKLAVSISPQLANCRDGVVRTLTGIIEVNLDRNSLLHSLNESVEARFDTVCRAKVGEQTRYLETFVVRSTVQIFLVKQSQWFIAISLEPRAQLVNNLPVSITVRTPMPHTYSSRSRQSGDSADVLHDLNPGNFIEVFTPGTSVAVTLKVAEMAVSGTPIGWMESWIDLPLVPEFRLPEPLSCFFPFDRKRNDQFDVGGALGSEFFFAEGTEGLAEFFDNTNDQGSSNGSDTTSSGVELWASSSNVESQREFVVTVCNYAVDYTGRVLFKQYDGTKTSFSSLPFSTFVSQRYQKRITMLPGTNVRLQLLHLTIDGDDGMRKSMPFRVEDIAVCEGGVESTCIPWEDGSPSGYFAYRRLMNDFQSEICIIPEFVVFNGSKHQLVVKQRLSTDVHVEPGRIKTIFNGSNQGGLLLQMEFEDLGVFTAPIRLDSLGLRIAVVKSTSGSPVGSLAIQTVIGTQDSRLVVKVGEVTYGAQATQGSTSFFSHMLKSDYFRFRLQASELRLTLDEIIYASDNISPRHASPAKHKGIPGHFLEHLATQQGVCSILLHRFTVDWQRVFKVGVRSEKGNHRSLLESPERSQLSVIIHNVTLTDESLCTKFPVVLDSSSQISFLDLCVRVRGSMDSELVKIDLFDLNLASNKEKSSKVILSTSEDFVWKLLDLSDRIISAAADLAGVDMKLTWDGEHGGYNVTEGEHGGGYMTDGANYTPPNSDRIYDIKRVRVSPLTLNVSFERDPQASRYTLHSGGKGSRLMNYFIRRLKFKIEKADLRFSQYETNNLKGPPDRLFELLKAVYMKKTRKKVVTIMTAASFQDWKHFASRDSGEGDFVEGDILRVTGNLAGTTAGFLFKKVGKGLGKGVSNASSTIGDKIESASGKIGARGVGAGINSVVSGVGGGVGETLLGVGDGASKVFKGAGKGIGHVAGGVTGGVLLVGKGIGKGVTQGDGRAVVAGISEGVTSIGSGVGKGMESAFVGAAGGAFSVGRGLFSGVKTAGKGIGGAFKGKKPRQKPSNPGN